MKQTTETKNPLPEGGGFFYLKKCDLFVLYLIFLRIKYIYLATFIEN